MKWHEILYIEDQKVVKAFYNSIPELKEIEITHMRFEAYGRRLAISCNLPFPDKEIQKWKQKGFNTAGTVLRFPGSHDILFTGTFGPEVIASLNIEMLEKELLSVTISSTVCKMSFKCYRLHLDKIEGYIINA